MSLAADANACILSPVSKTNLDWPANSNDVSAGTDIVLAMYAVGEPPVSTTCTSTVASFVPSTFVALIERTIAVVEAAIAGTISALDVVKATWFDLNVSAIYLSNIFL